MLGKREFKRSYTSVVSGHGFQAFVPVTQANARGKDDFSSLHTYITHSKDHVDLENVSNHRECPWWTPSSHFRVEIIFSDRMVARAFAMVLAEELEKENNRNQLLHVLFPVSRQDFV
jgi:hypothetical protein